MPDAIRARTVLLIVLATLSLWLFAISQTVSCDGDEGFHLLSAKLINAGNTPWADFFYQHMPLYPYILAFWMRIFGETWRSAHALSALLTIGAMLLISHFVYRHLRPAGAAWQVAGAATAALLFGLNTLTVQFGTIAQPYALCLFFLTASFTLAAAIEGSDHADWLALASGICAGAAIGTSLLSAPVVPITLFWIFRTRSSSAFRFLAGCAAPLLPFAWLLARNPRNTWFDVVTYQLLYRDNAGSSAERAIHKFHVLTEWLTSTQGLMVALLVLVSLAVGTRQTRLCLWLTAGLAIFLCLPSPTFDRYFILIAPFVSILSALGICAIGSKVWPRGSPALVSLIAVLLFSYGSARLLRDELLNPSAENWIYWQKVAADLNRLVPANSTVFMPEVVAFAAGRIPPPGLENFYSTLIDVPADFAHSLHAIPEAELAEQLRRGRFDAAVIYPGDPRVAEIQRAQLYRQRKDEGRLVILWDPAR